MMGRGRRGRRGSRRLGSIAPNASRAAAAAADGGRRLERRGALRAERRGGSRGARAASGRDPRAVRRAYLVDARGCTACEVRELELQAVQRVPRVVYRDATPPLALSVFFTALPLACFVCLTASPSSTETPRERPRRVGGGGPGARCPSAGEKCARERG